jgi:hypothetical protein
MTGPDTPLDADRQTVAALHSPGPDSLTDPLEDERPPLRPPQTWLLVLWPSFLSACVLSMLAFTFVSPGDLHWGDHAVELEATTAYSLAFLTFWAATGAAAALTAWLMRPPPSANDSATEGVGHSASFPGDQ